MFKGQNNILTKEDRGKVISNVIYGNLPNRYQIG